MLQINLDGFLGRLAVLNYSHPSIRQHSMEFHLQANEFRSYFLPNGMIRVGHMMLLRNQIIKAGLEKGFSHFLRALELTLLDAITNDQLIACLPSVVSGQPFGIGVPSVGNSLRPLQPMTARPTSGTPYPTFGNQWG